MLGTLAAAGSTVIQSARTQAGWLFADPKACAALGLAVFGEGMPIVEIDQRYPQRKGVRMSVQHSYAVVPLGRAGVCRLTVS